MRYLTTTKNLFDNIPVKTNYIINSNGEEVASPGFNIYGKIYGNNFTISTNAPVDLNNPDNWLRVCLYNSAGTFITRRDFDFNTRTVANIADDNIAYIQLCFSCTSFPNYKLQVELGSTATPYVPYGYLPMYKGRYKVSDVCQLLNKSKYPATKTSNGITWTNNGDGTITADGTATGGNAILNVQDSIVVVAGHKYLVSTDYTNQVRIQLYTTQGDIFAPYSTTVVPQIITCIKNYNAVYYQIVFINGVTVSGAILKPQLFDLTEMFGVGNEPTTVAEFREKFPNNSYPYSPYCWAKMKQMRYITTTKNLFDNILAGENCRVSFATSRAIATQISADTDTTGLFKIVSYNGSSYEILSWIENTFTRGRVISTFTTPETTGYKTIIFGLNGAKIGTTCQCKINLKPSTTYTFSCNFTNITQGSISWTDMQLEEGATATPYVPYGYLPLK